MARQRNRRQRREKMQAASFDGPEKIRVMELDIPAPGPGEVRVRLEGCGICASNLPVWEGRPWFEYPREPGAPGHEGWGYIDALGSGVRFPIPGDRVAFLSGHAYAEYDIAPADSVAALPRELDGKPFPGEPLGCAVNVFRRSGIRPGGAVAVVGSGFLGILLVALSHRAGARVIALSRRSSALETARKYGAEEIVLMDEQEKVIRKVRDLTDGNGCETVIETAGYQRSLDLAGELTAIRGKLVIAGYHQDGTRQVNMQLWNWRGLDVINAHERDSAVYIKGMQTAMSAVAGGLLDPFPLYTNRYGLEELQEAFQDLREHANGYVKGLLLL
ncbi:MAG: MDR/zinc-dependent alcohol dehydrogenase-like family protein [Candidatus Latescibacterota bacterium]